MSSNQKLVDYFVISGLNISSGLEPDQLSGYLFNLADINGVMMVWLISPHHEYLIEKLEKVQN